MTMNIQNKDQWDEAFIEACQKGEIEEVRQLCQKQYLDSGFADIHRESEKGFRQACRPGHLHIVKYLLTSKELIEAGHTFADLHADREEGFRWACVNGDLEMVKYLLTSQELKKSGHTFADLHAWNEAGFRCACAYGYLEVVKYLITSPELIEAGHTFANLHAVNDEGFRLACENKRWDVVRWLVMEYGIEKTSSIENILQDYPQAQEYFRAQEEQKEIEETMLRSAKLSSEELRSDKRAAKKAKKL